MASGMARKPKPSIPRREVTHVAGTWIFQVRLLALKNMLGLGLTPEEEAFLGPMPRVGVFGVGEVAQLLVLGGLPVDLHEALAKLGIRVRGSLP